MWLAVDKAAAALLSRSCTKEKVARQANYLVIGPTQAAKANKVFTQAGVT